MDVFALFDVDVGNADGLAVLHDVFAGLGFRHAMLTWSTDNAFAAGSAHEGPGDGLTDLGVEALRLMEEQLRSFRTLQEEPYELIPLPMAPKRYDEEGQRLPSTYANFLILNGAVLMPSYGDKLLDEAAQQQLQKAFPQHDIIAIDCQVLIQQHGSLHCCTMQFPVGVIK